jgi:hypothetical protein
MVPFPSKSSLEILLAQCQFVKNSGSDFTQGFYFYKPTPLEDL